ncbi:MAG: SIS domain-containing protein [Rhodospirillales bacterium]
MASFPEQPFESAAAFADAYFARLADACASADRAALARAADILGRIYTAGGQVFACGNGGSAAISNHLVCDHAKSGQTDTALRPRVRSLSADIEMITALANDLSYEEIFVYQLRTYAREGDALITVSSSGDSENVVRAAQWAKENGVSVIAMTGFSGGRTRDLADVSLHVKGDNYGVIEDAHQSLMHILAQYLRMAHMPENLVAARKF